MFGGFIHHGWRQRCHEHCVDRLQPVQNTLARAVFRASWSATASDLYTGITLARCNDARKLLDVTLDASLSFDKHVTNVVRACTFHTRALRHIRPLLTLRRLKQLLCPLCEANSTTATDSSMARRSGTLTDFSRCKTLWHALSSELRGQPVHLISIQKLHWLPIRERVRFNLAAATFKAKNSGLPAYLHDDLHYY